MELNPSHLHLGEVEQIIDDLEEVVAGVVNVLHVPRLLLRQGAKVLVPQDLGKTDDGVQGGPEFVAHIRQKRRLVAGGLLGLHQGLLEAGIGGLHFPGPLFHRALQALGVGLHLGIEAGVLNGGRGMGTDGREEVEVVLVERAVGRAVQHLDDANHLLTELEGDAECGLGGEPGEIIDPLIEPAVLSHIRDDEWTRVLEDPAGDSLSRLQAPALERLPVFARSDAKDQLIPFVILQKE